MHRSIIVLIISLFTVSCAFAQNVQVVEEGKVPTAIVQAFHKDFPGTDAQSWQSLPAAELQDQDYIVDLDDSQLNMTGDPYGYYIVDFYEDGTDATATYSNNGILVASQVTIDDADLPQAVSKAMHEQYPDWQITKEKEVFKNLDKTYYKVTIQKDNEHQTLYLNEQGVMIDKKSM